ncbi:hypothetical protein Tco_1035647 [Tanacetum coccineum]
MSWGWRKILQLRDIVKPFLWVRIGNGMSTSLWYDMWCSQSPISHFLSPRDITREGFTIQSKVADLVTNGTWNWLLSWLAKAPNLALIAAPILVNSHDFIQWRDINGNMADFSVKLAWEALRPCGAEVLWFKTVWFTHFIPRHAFHLWLFKGTRRSPEEIKDLIIVTVRLKLISFRFKNTLRCYPLWHVTIGICRSSSFA